MTPGRGRLAFRSARGYHSGMDRSPTFSTPWLLASVVIFTAVELLITLALAPALLVGRLGSPMLRLRLEMLMHLGSFWAGGLLVGVISPRVRMLEPAVGAFASVALVLMSSVFLPYTTLRFSTDKLVVGGGLAFLLALAGAYAGEKLMGNVGPDDPSARGKLRRSLWGERGVLSRGDPRWLGAGPAPLAADDAAARLAELKRRR